MRFIKQVTSNVKEHAPSWTFSRAKLNGIISQVNISSKKGLFCNSGFSNSICVKYLYLCTWVDGQGDQNFCLKSMH